MKKKVWIRVLGVVALLAWVWDYLVWHSAITTRPGLDRGYMAWAAIFFACGAGFITALWALFSLIDWTVRRQAKLQAANLAQQFGRTAAPAAAPAGWQPSAPAPAPGVPVCAACGAPAPPWWCYQHAVALCHNCAGLHHAANGACTWATAAQPRVAELPRPRMVRTSPLAGIK